VFKTGGGLHPPEVRQPLDPDDRLQPALAEALSKEFSLKVLDLDPANIGTNKQMGLSSRTAARTFPPTVKKADIIFATGSVLCNNTVDTFYQKGKKPLLFYGTTAAGASALFGIPGFVRSRQTADATASMAIPRSCKLISVCYKKRLTGAMQTSD
jgi:hypothetical protein